MMVPEFSYKLIAGALAAGLLLQWVFALFIKKWRQRLHFKDLAIKLDPIAGPLRLLIPAITVSVVLPLLSLPDPTQVRLQHFMQLWIIAALGWLLTRVVRAARDTILHRYDQGMDRFHARGLFTQVRIIEHIVNFMIWTLTIGLMIMTFAQAKEIGTSLFASAGIMSLIVGFAAQKTLGNLIAGIQIAIAQPIRLEDAVVVEGEWGWVEEITLTYVVVRIWDLRRLVLPISYFIEKPFQNWTRVSNDILGTVLLYMDYTVDVERVRQELDRILRASSHWDKKVGGLQVTDMKDRSVELRALVSAADSGACWDLRCEIREKLLVFLQEVYPDALPRTRMEIGNKEGLAYANEHGPQQQ